MAEVGAILGALPGLASTIQQLGNNWYAASNYWTDFPRQVQCLRRNNDFWQEEVTKFGLSSDKALIDPLLEAKRLLEAEEEKLRQKSLRNCFTGFCCHKLCMTFFPAQVGLAIDNVISAFNNILAEVTKKAEVEAALEARVLSMPSSLPFRKDDRYVPLRKTESAIRSALEKVNLDGPAVVLLHGGPGKGKSTVARAVALHYEEVANRKVADKEAAEKQVAAKDVADQDITRKQKETEEKKGVAEKEVLVFQHVVYLECGDQANISEMRFKLLQLLGSNEAVTRDHFQEKKEKEADTRDQSDSDADVIIAKRLEGRLRDQKVLIVLDDVRDGGLLQSMVHSCGSKVKCLVTSQLPHPFRQLNCSFIEVIPIEDVQPEDAKKILASHVGLRDHHIPLHLEEIADKMIQESERNPLALRSIAAGIDDTRSEELDAWQAASDDLIEMLSHESEARIQGMHYPRSFWSMMKQSIKSLGNNAQNLLILVHLCGELSVPEEVIELLYRGLILEPGPPDFVKSRKELESRELVKITLVSESPRKQRSWSIHSLLNRFIEGEMKDAREATFISLIGLSPTEFGTTSLEIEREVFTARTKGNIKITLAALYFEKKFAERVLNASKMDIDVASNFYKLRRNAIEPVTRLLGQREKKICTYAEQVFIGYIRSGVLDDEGVLNLLGSSLSTLTMLTIIKDIATIEETRLLLEENKHNFIEALIALMESVDTHASIRIAATAALEGLCDNKVRSVYILTKLPTILETVMALLLGGSNPQIRFHVLTILASLSITMATHGEVEVPSIKRTHGEVEVPSIKRIVQYPGALVGLVKLLQEKGNPPTQRLYVAIVLTSMTYTQNDEIKLAIANTQGMLDELAKALSKDDNPPLQDEAARVLGNLANGTSGEIKMKIINTHGLLGQLFKSCSNDGNPSLQVSVTLVLASLTSHARKVQLEIFNFPRAMELMVKSLSKHDNHEIQNYALQVINNIAKGILFSNGVLEEEQASKLKLLTTSCLMDALSSLLAESIPSDIQRLAARALTLIYPTEASEVHLYSAIAYEGRGYAYMMSRLYEKALADLDKANDIQPYNCEILRSRFLVKAKLDDYKGALVDANNVIENERTPFDLQERGVLKRMMGDLVGALADLDEGLNMESDDYERLKHRGYVKFLMKDEAGAIADAESALRVLRVLTPAYLDDPESIANCLGFSSVAYMNYSLR